MERNSQKTKERILAAALEEFSCNGIAGARVDRIAAAAQCNKQLIYLYFGGKEKLFEAVYEQTAAMVFALVAFDPCNLPEYIDQLCALFEEHPEVVRLEVWNRLERRRFPESESMRNEIASRLESIRQAQSTGAVSRRFQAEDLLALVGSLALTGGLSLSYREGGLAERARRDAIVQAVRMLTDPACQ